MKTKSALITGACVAVLALSGPLPASAQFKSASPSPSPTASAAEKMPRAIPFHGKASAIDQSAKTFAIAGKEASRTFKATDKTTVTHEGKAASFADLADEMKVTGSYWKQSDGTLELKSLKIGGKMEGEKTTKKSKKDAEASASPMDSPSPSASPKKK
jgi:hypothetical protein